MFGRHRELKTSHGLLRDYRVVRLGFEIKRTSAPGLTPSMRSALADLNLTRLDVIHAGDSTFPLTKEVRAVAFRRLLDDVSPLP